MESKVADLPLSHKAYAWFEKNKRPAIWGLIIVAAVTFAAWLVTWKQREKQAAAGRALSDVNLAQSGFGAATQESAQPYLKIVNDYPNSKAAARALLLAAGTLFTQGKYAEAEAQFQRFSREYRTSSLLGQALLGVAASLEAQGKVEQAINSYKELISRHPNDSVVPQAKFALGRLYEAQNKNEQARDMYQSVTREAGFSSVANEAGMRLEELLQKYPNLAPPPAPAPAPAPISLTPTPVIPASTGAVSVTVPTNVSAPATSK